MNLAVETYQNDGRHLPVDSNLLKNESFFKKHTVSLTPSHTSHPHTLTPSQVFACSDAEDYERPFRESEMNKLIEVHVNSSLFYVTIPPPPQRRQGQIPIHWFTHTLVLPYSDSHTLVLPYSDSHTLVHPYIGSPILRFPYIGSPILRFPYIVHPTQIPIHCSPNSDSHTLVPSYSHSHICLTQIPIRWFPFPYVGFPILPFSHSPIHRSSRRE